jgi:hypothetical protein
VLRVAGVVKLVDAEDSKSSDRKVMSVRFRPPAPKLYQEVAEFAASFYIEINAYTRNVALLLFKMSVFCAPSHYSVFYYQ